MKVLVFSSLFPNNMWPNHGVFVKERMSAVARTESCELRVVAPVPYFPPFKLGSRWRYSQVVAEEVIEDITVYHPKYFILPKVGMMLYGILMFVSVLPFLKRLKREFNFELIDAHYVYPDGMAGVLLARYFQCPVVVSARGSDVSQYSQFNIIKRLLKLTLQKANHVIAVCDALKEAMVELEVPFSKITVIPNGVDSNRFRPIPKFEARRRLGLPHDQAILLSVGALIPRKGYDLLLGALALLRSSYPQGDKILLLIIGEGKEERKLKQIVADLHLVEQVRFVGSRPHGELPAWYNSADIFCLASIREGWPNVLMESIACGTPVVAPRIWGIPEIITSEKIGFLSDRNEVDMARLMRRALESQWDRQALIQYSHARNWDHAAKKVLDIFNSVLYDEKRFG